MIRRSELSIVNISGSLRSGGWTASGNVLGDTDAVHQGLNWCIKGKSLAGFVDPENRIALNCHIIADPDYQFDRYSSQANFGGGTVDRFLEAESVQDISFTVVASPANSHEATSWRFSEMIEHILQQHCNYIYDPTGAAGSPDGVVTVLDLDGNSTQLTENAFFFVVRHSENMWRSLQQIGGGDDVGGEFYNIRVTRRNEIIYGPSPPFVSPKPDPIGTLDKSLIKGAVRVQLHNSQPGQRIGQVEIKAVADHDSIFVSAYPASPGRGKVIKKDRIWAQDQTRTDLLAERLYKWLTRAWTIHVEVDAGLVLFGDDGRGLELGDRVLITYDGPAEDVISGAGVHLDITEQSAFVYAADVRYDPVKRTGMAALTLEMDNDP